MLSLPPPTRYPRRNGYEKQSVSRRSGTVEDPLVKKEVSSRKSLGVSGSAGEGTGHFKLLPYCLIYFFGGGYYKPEQE